MRLDKFISNSTGISRSNVKKLLKAGAITINRDEAKDPAYHVQDYDEVLLDGEPVQTPAPRYFMLNKPVGYVSALKDGNHATVMELIDEPLKDKLRIVGRLDIDTTGLLLITDDGQWLHRITSPKHDCSKRYYALTANDIDPNAVDKFAKGILLEGERNSTKPASLEIIYSNEARLTISEGKYHQVKRMFAATGNRVEELHREAIGAIELDPELEPGEYRPLTQAEIESV
ncbi:MAG: 16S rRNA pseudouridine(516) synthase RsuA [Cellvibrionaceae bacterium]